MSFDVFDAWGELTRVFFSTKIALDRESRMWSSIELGRRDDVEIEVLNGIRKYRVGLVDHVRITGDEHPLCAMVLSSSYALVEAYARDRLGLQDLSGGIEAWGAQVLQIAGRDWADIFEGKQGLVEVAVARTAIAHGLYVTESMHQRCAAAGGQCPWAVGSRVGLTFETTNVYRDRLRSLLRVTQPL